MSNTLTVALDIGTTKICVMAGKLNEYGKLDVLAIGKVESTGVMRGVVSNIEKTVNAILDAKKIAERRAGYEFEHVSVGIASHHVKCIQNRGMITRDNFTEVITKSDINNLNQEMHKMHLPPGHKILHVLPQEYTIDDNTGILDPIGRTGVRLEANFNVVTAQVNDMQNIVTCVEKAGLKVSLLNLEPIASAEAVLSDEEKDEGVVLVDIGGGTTDISIFKDGVLRHTAVIPFGGNIISNDIKEGCHIMKHQAEKLKVNFGNALADTIQDNRLISIPGIRGRGEKEISERNLALIIQSRMEEIFDHVIWQVVSSGYEKQLYTGIVITGGGSMLKNVDKLASLKTGMHCRIGLPNEHLGHGYDVALHNPIFATGIGLILQGLKNPIVEEEVIEETVAEPEFIAEQEEEEVHENVETGGVKKKFVNKISNWFWNDDETNI